MTSQLKKLPAADLAPDSRFKRVLKRFGIAGFLFFLIKGLLWLLIPAALAFWGQR